MYRVLARFRVAFLDEPLFVLGRHAGHLGANLARRSRYELRALYKLLREHSEAARAAGLGLIRRRLAYRYYRLARALESEGRAGAARKCLRQALRLNPHSLRAAARYLRLMARG